MDKPVERAPRSTTWMWAVGGGVLVLGVLAALTPTLRRWASADRAIDGSRLRLATVKRGDLERDVSAQGRIIAALHPTLYAPAVGTVALQVKAGTEVKQGQLLATIDSPELKSRLVQEKATLQSVRADFGRQQIAARQAEMKNKQAVQVGTVRVAAARRALERAKSLFEQGLLNRSDFEKAQDEVEVATLDLANAKDGGGLEKETLDFELGNRRLQVERQQAVVSELERQVEELTMKAPFDGMVATVSVQDRDAVTRGQAVLMVVNLGSFEVEFDLPENYATDVVPGTRAEVLYEGKNLAGRVTAVSPEVRDSQVRGTLVFEGEPPAGLRQSQRVSVRLLLERRPNVLKVARGSFLESGGGRQAYVVDAGVAVRREIAVGATSVSEVEIVKGLNEGDQVVLSDTSIFEGAKTVLIRN